MACWKQCDHLFNLIKWVGGARAGGREPLRQRMRGNYTQSPTLRAKEPHVCPPMMPQDQFYKVSKVTVLSEDQLLVLHQHVSSLG